MKRTIPALTALFMFAATFMVQAQYGTQKKADALFNQFAFPEAAETYKELVANDYNTDYAIRKLADCYWLLRDTKQAEKYYAMAVEQEGVDPDYYFNYALVLQALGKPEKAAKWAEIYRDKGGEKRKYRELKKSEVQDNFFQTGTFFEVAPVTFNTAFSDFGIFEFKDELYFVSSRPHTTKSDKKYKWNEQPFLDIYKRDVKGVIDPLPGAINSKFHEGPLAISPDGKYIYFSRNNYNNKRIGKDEEGVSHLKIYRAERVGDEWGNITDLPMNGADYSVSHPAISPDGKTLYFASDMPGSLGKSDIYKVAVFEDGSFGEIINLGDKVNTPENELFPHINNSNNLFFSSAGHGGYGLLDIYGTILNSEQEITEVINLGEPINSAKDDFSFFMANNGYEGYFSSNRKNDPFDDDIYYFEKIPPLMLRGLVKDSINHKPIPNALISLKDQNGNEIAFLETDANGRYEINIDREKDYNVGASHKKYQETGNKPFTSKDLRKRAEEVIVNFELVPVKDIRVLADLQRIYFDFDSYEIRDDAARELDKIVNLLVNEYPDMVMRIEAHTDSRGSYSYNDKLSLDRANATAEYLISKGLPEERIIAARGYGERKLTNGCADGVNCEEEQHQQNRRTKFTVERMQ
ncbi:OmpA family protein [Robertkochia sediminum]|uniref:OmpA family protein n=1 Tax=Robertkochia sediminum TaxID=2785326 RepID=UPI001F3F072A|nr:OmpA family protein [Robertkochia sediminum]